MISELFKKIYSDRFYLDYDILSLNKEKLTARIDLNKYYGALNEKTNCVNGTDAVHIISNSCMIFGQEILGIPLDVNVANHIVVSNLNIDFKEPLMGDNITVSMYLVTQNEKDGRIYATFKGDLDNKFFFTVSGALIEKNIHR